MFLKKINKINTNILEAHNKSLHYIPLVVQNSGGSPHEQAIVAALLFQQLQQQNSSGLGFDRSTSLRHPSGGSNSKCQQIIPRSSSTRRRSIVDPMIPPQQLLHQVCNLFSNGGIHALAR
ncbi:hypothetical protein L2E82_06037 [Cichorium intybus]|uniref:Uncharacterized protein n=1 Tax=Cichorium intybus TaxID=13427 RepID=A0ACB9HA14_CICIN|nr:hypothetical protein L2E82_06037 [Cichorium intybus]